MLAEQAMGSCVGAAKSERFLLLFDVIHQMDEGLK